MFKPIPKEIKTEILEKIKEGQKAPTLAKQYGVSAKTIYSWLAKSVAPEISYAEYSRLKRENEELKRIIGMMALDLEQEKKEKYVKATTNKKLIAKALGISRKIIYYQRKMDAKDKIVRDEINEAHRILSPKANHDPCS